MTPDLIDSGGWKEPTPLDLQGFHDRAVDWAVKRFHGKGKETLTGYFILVSTNGDIAILHMAWGGEEEKYRVAYFMRLMLQRMEFAAYSFITEAWAVLASKDSSYDFDTPPRLQPERQDVLQIWSVLRDGSNRMTHFAVRYYQHDRKPPRLLERDDHLAEYGDAVGTMFNFFIPYEENERRLKAAMDQARGNKQ